MIEKKMTRLLGWVLFAVAILMVNWVAAAETQIFSNAPKTNDGKKWRIGYYEGGPYQNYPMNLKAIVKGLTSLGWIEEAEIPDGKNRDDSSQIWIWLANNTVSKYIDFVQDAYWSANWDDQLRQTNKKDAIQRLSKKKDIDLMLAAGTWAGQDLANNQHSTPTIVFSVSDAVGSGIVKSVEDSGFDHVLAHLAPERYARQIRLFQDIIGFRTLGMAYENTEAGRSYAALKDAEKIAQERGIKIVSCYTKDDVPDQMEADLSVVQCMRELASKVDAVYITAQRGVNLKNMPNILAPLNEAKIPTFSQGGSTEVKHGVLLSIAQAEFKYVGLYHAKNIAKIFNGAKPRQLSQVFEDPAKIAINLETAQIIAYDPPVDILGAADEIYQDIATVDE